jgi:hypothetical protein
VPDQPDKTKQVLQEALQQLYGRAAAIPGHRRNYLQGGDGQFLGTITDNAFDRESIVNQYGPYGSKYSPTSIHNQYSKYGSPYSTLSINSPYATNPPILYLNGERRGPVSKNPYLQNRIPAEVFLDALEHDLPTLVAGQMPNRVPEPTGARAYLRAGDGTFLGSLDRNDFAYDSIFNHFGPYGSEFSPTSIFNEFGIYGGEFSTLSPFNSFTTTPPVIVIDRRDVAYLTKNTFLPGAKVDPDNLDQWLKKHGS